MKHQLVFFHCCAVKLSIFFKILNNKITLKSAWKLEILNSAYFVSSINCFCLTRHYRHKRHNFLFIKSLLDLFVFHVLRSNIKATDKSNYLHFNWCWLLTCRKNWKRCCCLLSRGYLKKFLNSSVNVEVQLPEKSTVDNFMKNESGLECLVNNR